MATIAEELAAAAVTDSLLRNENPLSNGGKWNKPSWDVSICFCDPSDGWDAQTAFPSGTDGARWIDQSLKAEGTTHVYSILQLSRYSSPQSAERWFATWACLHETTQSGYRVKAEFVSGTTYKFKLEKVVAGVAAVLKEANATMPVGGKLAIVVGEGRVYLYKQDEEVADFTEVVQAADTEFTEGFSGIQSRGNFFYGKNFAAGTFSIGPEAPEAPRAVTGAASSVTDTTATLNGTVDAGRAPTDYYFEYGPTDAYGTKIPATEDGNVGSDNEPIAVSESVTGLDPETTYHFRLVAVNAEGEDVGADETFTTETTISPGVRQPDLDGFRAASEQLRDQMGKALVYLTPTETTWLEGTPLDPETGDPWDPTIEPLASGFTSASATTIVVLPGATDRVAKEVEAAIGRIEVGDAALIIGRESWDKASLEDATLVRIYDDDWELADARFDSVGGEGPADRVIVHAKQRSRTMNPEP